MGKFIGTMLCGLVVLLILGSFNNAHASTVQTNKVVIYTTSTCPWCHKAMEKMDDLGIKYEERNITTSPNARTSYNKLGKSYVPVILVDGKEKKIAEVVKMHERGTL